MAGALPPHLGNCPASLVEQLVAGEVRTLARADTGNPGWLQLIHAINAQHPNWEGPFGEPTWPDCEPHMTIEQYPDFNVVLDSSRGTALVLATTLQGRQEMRDLAELLTPPNRVRFSVTLETDEQDLEQLQHWAQLLASELAPDMDEERVSAACSVELDERSWAEITGELE